MVPFKGKLASEAGFSLVELMVVVAIIGILAALAVPKYQNFQAKAKQGEAKNNLSQIYTLEQSYYGDNDAFVTLTCNAAGANSAGCGGDILGFDVSGNVRYNYSVTSAALTTSFLADAKASTNNIIKSGGGGLDEWTMDQGKNLAVVYDVTAH